MGLVWGLTEVTLKSALCGAWHSSAHYISFLLPPGWGVTAPQRQCLHFKALLSRWQRWGWGGSGDVSASTCGLDDGQTCPTRAGPLTLWKTQPVIFQSKLLSPKKNFKNNINNNKKSQGENFCFHISKLTIKSWLPRQWYWHKDRNINE